MWRERESTLEQCFGSVGDHDACSARLARCYTAAKLCIWRVAIRRNHQSRRCSVTSLCNHSLFRQRLVFHACEFQHISPFSRCALVAVLQVLPEVISPEEFLRLVAFAKFVHVVEVLGAHIPLRRVRELLSTIAANVVPATSSRAVKCCFHASKSGARPAVST